MAVEERDLRMTIVAFEDVVTWCENMTDLADSLLAASAGGRRVPEPDLQTAKTQVAETRRQLEAHVAEVARIKTRTGLE